MPGTVPELQAKAFAADHEWQAALAATYGRDARAARYDTRGTSTPTLAALYLRKVEAWQAFRLAAFPHAAL